jgi:hypothetical protein
MAFSDWTAAYHTALQQAADALHRVAALSDPPLVKEDLPALLAFRQQITNGLLTDSATDNERQAGADRMASPLRQAMFNVEARLRHLLDRSEEVLDGAAHNNVPGVIGTKGDLEPLINLEMNAHGQRHAVLYTARLPAGHWLREWLQSVPESEIPRAGGQGEHLILGGYTRPPAEGFGGKALPWYNLEAVRLRSAERRKDTDARDQSDEYMRAEAERRAKVAEENRKSQAERDRERIAELEATVRRLKGQQAAAHNHNQTQGVCP